MWQCCIGGGVVKKESYYIPCQLFGILGFCFTNSYLAMKYFGKTKQLHCQFKTAAPNAQVHFEAANLCEWRKIDDSKENVFYVPVNIAYSKDCY